MKLILSELPKKFDELDEGRRKLIFIATLALLALAAHLAFIEPFLAEKKALLRKLSQTQSEMKTVNAQIENLVMIRLADPDLDNKKRLAELRARLAEKDASLDLMQSRLITPEKMADLLEKMLKENPRVKLVEFHSLSASAAPEESGAAAQAKPAEPGQVLFRQGLTIAVRGSFPDLLQYVADLKKLPWQIYWDKMDYKVDEYPTATMNLTVHTLSLDRSWLNI